MSSHYIMKNVYYIHQHNMLINPITRVKNFAVSNPAAMRYAMDGLFAALAVNIAANNNNLFAIRL